MTDCRRSVGPMAANDPNNANQCVITEGAYSGNHAQPNGVLIDGPYAGEEIGLCSNLTEGLSGSRFIEIPGMTFASAALSRLRTLFNVGDSGGRSGAGTDRVILCAGSPQAGVVGIDIGQQAVARRGIEQLMSGGIFRNHGSTCMDLFPGSNDAHSNCSSLVDTLRSAYTHSYAADAAKNPLETPWETAWHYIKTGLISTIGLFGVFLVFGPALHRYQDWRNAKKNKDNNNNDGNPPTAGAGGGGAQGVAAVVPGMGGNTSARVAMPDVANGILAFHQGANGGANGHTPGVRAPGAVPVTGAPVARPGILVAPVIPAPVPVPAPVVAPIVVPRPVFAIP